MKEPFRFNLCRFAANVATAENSPLIVSAANDRPISGDEWEQVTPWGNFPNVQGLQRFTQKEGQAMMLEQDVSG